MRVWSVVVLAGMLVGGCTPAVPKAGSAAASSISARIVAVGIPGASAISPVGQFKAGGPIHDKPNFAAYTEAGKILDPERILVTSSSNFGAPKARADEAEGGVLSIDPRGSDVLVVPPTFAANGGQAGTASGRVQLFTAQSPAFINSLTAPNAVTGNEPAVSNPLSISINNAFGRIWFANMPTSAAGYGTETIIDPDGRPLAEAPFARGGGVFAGTLTNRPEQKTSGAMSSGAIANVFLGHSPDGSTKAVFAVANADGSIVQAHAGLGVDGLAGAATIHPTSSRTGMLFNWTPDRILYVADSAANRLVAVTLSDDGAVFHADNTRPIEATGLSNPIDLAAAVPEVGNPDFTSNTTLAGGSDMYVANRGNGTIVRLKQDGKVVAVRTVQVPGLGDLGADKLNGIAVSPDASKIWLTVSTGLPGYADAVGAVLEVPAFGGAGQQ